MSTLKCKMCGGSLDITENATTATCEYCGTEQTIPKTTNDVIGNLFNRANTLRLKSEFDKAEETYNKIIEADKTQAEAYWGVILCKYGIEYVEDPATFKRVPTCHRTSFEAITADEDYKLALQYADISQKILYEDEAKAIDEIQRGILAISQNEKPYDVFICYKETDESGKRTTDSVIANDIYHQLTQEGFKVFYAAITLEDKLGQEYEPYIFAALNSAKVMLVIGSKPEYFTAVWVKNEWSRFMKLMKSDRSKLLIPCYKDMDAYELPEEFAHLQAQDMSKIGFINDIVRGIKKVVQKDEPKAAVKEPAVQQAASMTASNASPLLKRAFMSIEDREWEKANDFCEKALNIDPENAEAYLCKLMIELKCYSREDLKDCAEPFDNSSNYKKALRFADKNLKDELAGYINYINDRNENERKCEIYNYASDKMNSAANEEQFRAAAELFKSISGFRDSDELEKECLEKATYCVYVKATSKMKSATIEIQFKDAADIFRSISGYKDSDELEKICLEKAEEARKEDVYISAQKHYNSTDISTINRAIKEFQSIPHYKDSDNYITRCRELIQQINEKREKERIENERKKEEAKLAAEKRAKIRKRILIAIPFVVALCAVGVVLWFSVISPMINYNNAVKLMSDGKYSEAISAFTALGEYRDSENQILECKKAVRDIEYNNAISLMNEGKLDEAITLFSRNNEYKESSTLIIECKYKKAVKLMEDEKYIMASTIFSELNGYKDSNQMVELCQEALKENDYNNAISLMKNSDYDNAISSFKALGDYKDSKKQIEACENAIRDITYSEAIELLDKGKYSEAITKFSSLNGYKNSNKLIEKCRRNENITVGDVIELGTYEQDNNFSNGAEQISWRIIAREGNKALLLSYYALDCIPYNTTDSKVTWENSSIRRWLNNDFYTKAFSNAEKQQIVRTPITADKNPKYSESTPGNDTNDNVFLLSIKEKNWYVDSLSMCEATDYAKARGAYIVRNDGYLFVDYWYYYDTCLWWLRTVGGSNDSAVFVDEYGSINNYGYHVAESNVAVRPAMWINLA
ncbi:MAG: DUF6273 domain-containing protein [Ruminiclostridium sp.]